MFDTSTSRFSKFLLNHPDVAIHNLDSLSKKQAKQFYKFLADNTVPWKVAILIDSTLQARSSRHPENAKKFNHGKGFVIGHQWTNIVLVVNDIVVPLKPIAFYSKKYCKNNGLTYKGESDLVVEYIDGLDLKKYIGPHKSHEIVVLADSGYDAKKIEQAIVRKKWKFIIALKKCRSVKSERENENTNKSSGWSKVADLFRKHRWAKWQTVRVPTNSAKRKRMEFRIRQIVGYLRYVGKVQLICSEFKKRPDGRRKYLACNDLKAKARQIIIGYRIRWAIEIFHKQVKMFLGFEDVATKHFASVISHVHWVYCAYILLNNSPPGISDHCRSLAEKQRMVEKIISTKETSRVIQMLTQFNGPQRYKEELQQRLLLVS
ncbi:MAG: transposase [Candidatus Electrothrix sp. GW3-4]|uniref:transposase n=1 Tax=Candidatus Electrothrix sp. GW3-4 TaxID=3126740 RepID=UPI0030D20AE4